MSTYRIGKNELRSFRRLIERRQNHRRKIGPKQMPGDSSHPLDCGYPVDGNSLPLANRRTAYTEEPGKRRGIAALEDRLVKARIVFKLGKHHAAMLYPAFKHLSSGQPSSFKRRRASF